MDGACQEHSRHILSLLNCVCSFVCLVAGLRGWGWAAHVGSPFTVWIPRMELRSSGLPPEPALWPSSGMVCCASEQTSLGSIHLNRIALLVVVARVPSPPPTHTLIGWFAFWYEILLCSSGYPGTQYVTETDLEHTAIPLPHTCSQHLQVWAAIPSF